MANLTNVGSLGIPTSLAGLTGVAPPSAAQSSYLQTLAISNPALYNMAFTSASPIDTLAQKIASDQFLMPGSNLIGGGGGGMPFIFSLDDISSILPQTTQVSLGLGGSMGMMAAMPTAGTPSVSTPAATSASPAAAPTSTSSLFGALSQAISMLIPLINSLQGTK